MDVTSKFWDRLADRYAADPIADEKAYEIKLAATRELFSPETEVLELGCGTGSTAIKHAPYVASVTALDFSQRMLEIARQRAAAAKVDNITFRQADITALDIAPASFDVVLALSVLHLLKSPEALIGSVYATLKPGGHFVTSTACLGDTMKFMKYLAPIGQALGKLPQLSVMSADELVGMVRAEGFDVVHRWQPNRKAALFLIARKPG